MNGPGTLVLGAANTYTGPTTVAGGVLVTGVANAVSPSSNLTVDPGATFDLGGNNDTLGSLQGNGNVTLHNGTLTIGLNNANATFDGSIGGTGCLTKIGTGTLTLTEDNTFNGTLTINGGSVILQGSGLLQPGNQHTINIIVNGGGTLVLDDTAGSASPSRLGGICGTVNVTLTGGEFQMLGSSSGNTTENFGTLTLDSGSSTVTVIPLNTTYSATLAGTGLVRNPGATVLFRGTGLGTGSNGTAEITFGSAPYGYEVGNGTTANPSNLHLNTPYAPILPWALGDRSPSGTGFLTSNPVLGTSSLLSAGFVTYDPLHGVRPLNGTEYAQPVDGTPFTSSPLPDHCLDENVYLHAGAYTINGTTLTWNSVLMPANDGFLNGTTAMSGILNVVSGAISIGDGINGMGLTTLHFGNSTTSAEGIIAIGNDDLTMARNGVSTVITGNGLTKTGPNQLTVDTSLSSLGSITVNEGQLDGRSG